jgi:hypothetical protein
MAEAVGRKEVKARQIDGGAVGHAQLAA